MIMDEVHAVVFRVLVVARQKVFMAIAAPWHEAE